MITNLVEVLILTVLATNVAIRPETRSVSAPCPEGRPGCAVAHSKEEPVENPRWRTVETKVVEIRRHSMPSIGKTWDEEKVLSQDIRFEFRSETWTEDLERSAKLRDGGVLLNIYGSGLPMIVPTMRASPNIVRALGGTNAVATNAIISKL